MVRTISALLYLASILSGAQAQSGSPTSSSPTAKTLGLELGIIPEALRAHLPALKPGQGILVEQVYPQSAAAQLGIARHDILLSLGKTPLRDADQFTSLVFASTADQKTPLLLIRSGKELTLQVTWLHTPKGVLKLGGPPAVKVEAQTLSNGKLSVTLTYFTDVSGKLERVTCSGSLPEIENQVRELGVQNRMPPRVQDLVDVALKRIRDLNSPQR